MKLNAFLLSALFAVSSFAVTARETCTAAATVTINMVGLLSGDDRPAGQWQSQGWIDRCETQANLHCPADSLNTLHESLQAQQTLITWARAHPNEIDPAEIKQLGQRAVELSQTVQRNHSACAEAFRAN